MTRVTGQNKLVEAPPKTPLQCFLEQLNDPLIFILFIAAAISMLLREFSDTFIILAVILLNATVGVVQEGKAKRALDSLKKMTSPKALILSEGHPKEIPACDLMVGDTVLLDAGRQVPADLKLTSVNGLKIEEAALTGESLPVEKDLTNNQNAYMATNVTYGRGEGMVSAIGMDTEIGRIAQLMNETKPESTPLQKRLADLGKILSILSILLCVLLFGIALLQRRDPLEMLITAISLAVAAVPEGLPAIVTMVLALSVSKMVKVNTIVKKLPSVETLGCVSVVCSDKTGTLTQNKMTVVSCYTNGRLEPVSSLSSNTDQHFLEGFLLCNDADYDTQIGDPTELTLLNMADDARVSVDTCIQKHPRIKERSFDSDRKMMSTLHKTDSGSICYTKGSPDEILGRCKEILSEGRTITMSETDRKHIRKALDTMSAQGLRMLALAMRKNDNSLSEQGMVFLGIAGMQDPLRPEVFGAVNACKKAGVRTIMITGDRVDTAYAIASNLDIVHSKEDCLSGEELTLMSADEVRRTLSHVSVFAHVSPENKVQIVNGLKANGAIVAMTGDGVNDAPSLRGADVGIAMGITGTDVAKNAADIILTDDNFATIVKAIAQGRCIYANIKKAVLFLLSSNFGEIITMLTAIVLGLSTPLKPSHILWINLITDSLPALALGVDSMNSSHFMERPPRPKNEHLFAHGGLACTVFYGLLIGLISMVAFLQLPIRVLLEADCSITLPALQTALEVPAILTRSQTFAFTVLGMSQLFHAIGMRDVETSIFRFSHFSNRLMILAVIIGVSLQVLVTHVPFFVTAFGTCALSLSDWISLAVLSSAPIFAHELLVPKGRSQ